MNIRNLFNEITKSDPWITVPYFILCGIGIIMVYSSSSDIGSPVEFMLKQMVYVIIGIGALMFTSHLKLSKLRSRGMIFIGLGIFIALLSALKFIGHSINGAAGWFTIGGMSFQPSELSKLFFVIYMANALTNRQTKYLSRREMIIASNHGWLYNFFHSRWNRSMIPPLSAALFLIALIYIQPDLGGAVINLMIVLVMITVCGKFKWQRVLIAWGSFIVALVMLLTLYTIPLALSPSGQNNYQLQRIVAFIRPFKYAQGIGKQLVNSYYALSNGGIFGVGLGNSIQKSGYLPEPNTDFIMAIVAEELGLITVIIIMSLLALIVARIVLIGIRDDSSYYSLICYGIATYITIEMLFNMGGVVGLLPITGVTFPFISYGGSSLLTLSLGMGIVLHIDRTQERRKFRIKLREET